MQPGLVGLLIFRFYLVLMILIGIISGRQQKSAEDFWVAGRRFNLPVMVMGNMAAIMHGGSILSGVAFAARFGGVAILPYISFALGSAVIFFFFAKKLREMRVYTLPDYMGDRFESNGLRAWSAVVVAASSILYLIAQIRAMGFVLHELLDIPFSWGLVLGSLIFVFYTALGGLLAVVWTNIAQFLFMWVGLLVLLPPVFHLVGGWTEALGKVETVAPGWTTITGTAWSLRFLLSWYVIWLVAYCTRLEFITKMFAARDHKVARYSVPLTIFLIMIFLLYGNLYLGAAARVLVWDQIKSPDQAFPRLVAVALSPLLASIALTGIASAAMSTTDSLLLLSGAAIAHDLIRRCYHEPRGIRKDEAYYLRVSRWTVVAVGLLALLGSIPNLALILAIVSYAVAIVGATFFFPLIAGLTIPKTSKPAASASSVGGAVVTSLWIYWTLKKVPWALTVHPGIPGLLVAGALMLAVGMVTGPVSERTLVRFFPGRAGSRLPAGDQGEDPDGAS